MGISSWLMPNKDRTYKGYLIRLCGMKYKYYAVRLNNSTIRRVISISAARRFIDEQQSATNL